MKLRILENSIRLRLSASEVFEFLAERRLANRICFGADESLAYTIEISSDADPARVSFDGRELRIILAESQARTWGEDPRTGIHQTLETPEGTLELLIEQDRKP